MCRCRSSLLCVYKGSYRRRVARLRGGYVVDDEFLRLGFGRKVGGDSFATYSVGVDVTNLELTRA